MSTNNKKNLLKTISTAHVGCGCGKPKLSDVYEPTPKPKNASTSFSSSSGEKNNNGTSFVIDNEDYASTSLSFNIDTSTQHSESETDPRPSKVISPCPKIVDSIAVVKDSKDPYQDFRHSMLQMITGKEIYSKDDLTELLNCFLELNSPCHHDIIIQAFTEIWNKSISNRPDHLQKPCVHEGDKSHGY